MVRAVEPYMSYEQYLDAEQQSTVKHEWLDGIVYAMALVSQTMRKIEVLRRPERGHWQRDEACTGDSIQIFGASIKVDDVYRMPEA